MASRNSTFKEIKVLSEQIRTEILKYIFQKFENYLNLHIFEEPETNSTCGLTPVRLHEQEKQRIEITLDNILPRESIGQFNQLDTATKEAQLDQLFLLSLGVLLLKAHIKPDSASQINPVISAAEAMSDLKKSRFPAIVIGDLSEIIRQLSQNDGSLDFTRSLQRALCLLNFRSLLRSIFSAEKTLKSARLHFSRELDLLRDVATNRNQQCKTVLFPLFKKVARLFLDLKTKQIDIFKNRFFFEKFKGASFLSEDLKSKNLNFGKGGDYQLQTKSLALSDIPQDLLDELEILDIQPQVCSMFLNCPYDFTKLVQKKRFRLVPHPKVCFGYKDKYDRRL